MLYEEDFEDNHIDCPEPYDPDAIAGNFEEHSNVYDNIWGLSSTLTLAQMAAPERGLSRKDSRGKTDGQLAMATTTHSSIQGGMRSRSMGSHMNMPPMP